MPSNRVTPAQLLSVAAGNAFEFYDFLTYAFFAVQIGETFFPSEDRTASLLASLAIFGVGFLTRPVGAFVIGRYADRAGRKPAMMLSFSLMGLSVLGLALTPSFARIGLAAPIIAIGLRLVQGFALGGEIGPSTAYLIEAAPPLKRGLYVSLQYLGQDAAVLVAGLIGFALSSVMDAHALGAIGWRLAFAAGLAIMPFALFMRRRLNETLDAPDQAEPGTAAPVGEIARRTVLGVVLLATVNVVTYLLDYITTYANATLHMSLRVTFSATIALGVVCLLSDPIGGLLSDRFGRRKVAIGGWGLLAVIVVPLFSFIVRERSAPALLLAVAVMGALSATASAGALVAVTESIPKASRARSLSLIYATAVTVFGSSAQFNVTKISAWTHSPLVPAWYMAVAIVAGVCAMLATPETAPRFAAKPERLPALPEDQLG